MLMKHQSEQILISFIPWYKIIHEAKNSQTLNVINPTQLLFAKKKVSCSFLLMSDTTNASLILQLIISISSFALICLFRLGIII